MQAFVDVCIAFRDFSASFRRGSAVASRSLAASLRPNCGSRRRTLTAIGNDAGRGESGLGASDMTVMIWRGEQLHADLYLRPLVPRSAAYRHRTIYPGLAGRREIEKNGRASRPLIACALDELQTLKACPTTRASADLNVLPLLSQFTIFDPDGHFARPRRNSVIRMPVIVSEPFTTSPI